MEMDEAQTDALASAGNSGLTIVYISYTPVTDPQFNLERRYALPQRPERQVHLSVSERTLPLSHALPQARQPTGPRVRRARPRGAPRLRDAVVCQGEFDRVHPRDNPQYNGGAPGLLCLTTPEQPIERHVLEAATPHLNPDFMI